MVPFAENDRLNTLQKSPVSPKGKSSEPIFGFKMCSKNFRGTFCFRNFGPPTKNAPNPKPETSRNIPNCRDFSTWKTPWLLGSRYQAPRSRSGWEPSRGGDLQPLEPGFSLEVDFDYLFWAIYNDQTAGWSPQMVVKSKGSVPKMALN